MGTAGKTISVTTDLAGDASAEVRLYGVIVGIGVRLGTLSTPDVTITDGLTGAPVYSDTALVSDVRVIPRVPVQDEGGDDIPSTYDKPVITGLLRVVIAGGGAVKTGEIVIIYEA